MAERFKKHTTQKSNSYSETNFPPVFDTVSRLDASKITISTSDDDLISSLQNRVENIRARQVFEWELVRRDNAAQQNRYYGAV